MHRLGGGHRLWLVCALVFGCNTEHTWNDPSPKADTADAESDAPVLSAFVQYHGGLWGEWVPDCSFEITIRPRASGNDGEQDTGSPDDDGGGGIAYPQEDGTCELTQFERSKSEDDSEDEATEAATATEYAYLYGADGDLELTVDTERLEAGVVLYRLDPCNTSTYPFDTLFDFELPSTEGGFGPLYAENVLYTGLPLEVLAPTNGGETQDISQTDTLHTEWQVTGSPTVFDGEESSVSSVVTIRNCVREDDFIFEALACAPETGEMTVDLGPDQWDQLEPTTQSVDPPYYTSLQIDTQTWLTDEAPEESEFEFMSATVSVSGTFHLFAAETDP